MIDDPSDCPSNPGGQYSDVARFAEQEAAAALAGQQSTQAATAITLATVLPLAALVAAGAAGRVLWQRRLRRRRHAAARAAAWQGGSNAPNPVPLPPLDGRRRRVQELLASSPGGLRQRIGLMPLEALPDALAHHVASMRHRRPGTPTATATQPVEQELPLWSAHTPVEDVLPLLWQPQSSSSGSGGEAPPGSRQWRLDTQSLQLSAGELELVVASDGLLTLLGEGRSTSVYLGRLSGREVAVKVGWCTGVWLRVAGVGEEGVKTTLRAVKPVEQPTIA